MADRSEVELGLDSTDMTEALDDAEDSFLDFGTKVSSITESLSEAWDDAVTAITDKAKSLFTSAMDYIVDYVSGVIDDIVARVNRGTQAFMKTEQDVLRLNQALRITGNITGFTGDQLQKIAEQLSQITTYSADAFRSAEMTLIKFGNVRGDVFKDALKAAADLAAVTGDLTGAADKLGEALNDPIKGLEMLTEAGYKFSRGQLDLIEKLKESNNMIGLQKFVLKTLGEVIGGNAEAQAKTFAGQIDRLNNILDNMFEKIGSLLVPSLTQYFIPAAEAAGKIVDHLIKKFNEMGDTIGPLVQKGIDIAVEYFWKFVDVAVQAFSFVQTAIEDLPAFFEGSWFTIKAITLDALATIIEYFADWVEKAKEGIEALWNVMKDLWVKIVMGAQIAVEGMGEGFRELWNYLADVLNRMMKGFRDFWNGVRAIFRGDVLAVAFDRMEKGFSAGIDKMKKKLEDLKLGGGEFDPDEFANDLREAAKKAEEDAEQSFEDFDDRFGQHLDRNRERMNDWIEYIKKILAGEDIDPTKIDKMFNFGGGKGDKDKENENVRSSVEDLVSLNKRISSAALLSPEAKKLDDQTALMRDWKGQDDKNFGFVVNGLDDIVAALKDKSGKNVSVFQEG